MPNLLRAYEIKKLNAATQRFDFLDQIRMPIKQRHQHHQRFRRLDFCPLIPGKGVMAAPRENLDRRLLSEIQFASDSTHLSRNTLLRIKQKPVTCLPEFDGALRVELDL